MIKSNVVNDTIDGNLIPLFEDFFLQEHGEDINEVLDHESPSITIEYDSIYEYDPDLAEGLVDEPLKYYFSAREALRTLPESQKAKGEINGAPYDSVDDVGASNRNPLGYVDLRISETPNTVQIRQIRASDVTDLVSVEGRVKKKTEVLPKVDVGYYKCTDCGKYTQSKQPLDDGRDDPENCGACGGGPLIFDWNESHLVNLERIEIEENPEALTGGETPESIKFYNWGDTVGTVNPGQRVTAIGILEPEQNDDSAVFGKRIRGVNIKREQEAFEDLEISDLEIEEIKELASRDDIYELIRDSIAPGIYGYEQQKFALALALFGGVTKQKGSSYIRGDIHTLSVGDPGTGKSELLEYAHSLAPRGVYTSGKGSSSAGLCVGGDTYIETDDGFERIDSIIPDRLNRHVSEPVSMPYERRVATYNVDNDEFGYKNTSHIWSMPRQKTVEIVTDRGKSVTVSSNTPVLVYRDDTTQWIEASDVDETDTLVNSPPQVSERHSLNPDNFYEFDNKLFELSSESRDKIRKTISDEFGSVSSAASALSVTESVLSNQLISYVNLSKISASTGLSLGEIETKRISSQDGDEITLPDTFDRELMWLIGGAISDATVEQNDIVKFSNDNEDLLNRYANIIERKFGMRPEMSDIDECTSHLSLNSGIISDFFGNLGVINLSEDSAILTSELTKAKHANALLSGLFDAKASVHTEENGTVEVLLPCMNRELAEQIQLMLETYGIYAAVEKQDRPINEWVIEISGGNIDVFADSIGFTVGEYSDSINTLLQSAPHDDNTPYSSLQNQNVILESVSSVDTGEEKLFDMTVPETHSFFGNGICIHNTAAAVQEETLSGESTWTLEAGALVLADKGIAAIDEIDKMESGDRDSLHEALQSQKISVNKAGINATLKARCGVLAAANPKLGKFDQYEPISDQIDLDPALISRFDLIFTITDTADRETDSKIAKHIISVNQADDEEDDDIEEEVDVEDDGDVKAAIPLETLQKYIAYARNNCFPDLSDEAGDRIEEFYVELRQESSGDTRSATARQLQSLVRLAEASARMRLSDEVELRDAEVAIDITRSSLEEVSMDPETGELDAGMLESGISGSKADRRKSVKNVISVLEEDFDDGVPKEELLDNLQQNSDITESQLEETISDLITDDEIYEPRQNYYSTL